MMQHISLMSSVMLRELIFAYAKTDRLSDIEEFILMPNVANLQHVGDRLYDEELYEAAKIIYAFISNWAKLMEHIKLFSTHLNIPKLIRPCEKRRKCFHSPDDPTRC